jgi:hypothetical protein
MMDKKNIYREENRTPYLSLVRAFRKKEKFWLCNNTILDKGAQQVIFYSHNTY